MSEAGHLITLLGNQGSASYGVKTSKPKPAYLVNK